MHQRLQIEVNENAIIINGHRYVSKSSHAEFEDTLGSECRIHEYGPPAPVGHSNNKALIYDQHGVYLFQHHSSNLIRAIAVVYDVEGGACRMSQPFCGNLTVLGQEMPPKPTLKDIPRLVVEKGRRFDNIYNLRLDRVGISFEARNDGSIGAIEAGFH